jgi:hypothetical protein
MLESRVNFSWNKAVTKNNILLLRKAKLVCTATVTELMVVVFLKRFLGEKRGRFETLCDLNYGIVGAMMNSQFSKATFSNSFKGLMTEFKVHTEIYDIKSKYVLRVRESNILISHS